MSRSLNQKWHALCAALEKDKRVLVAFSAGCDSTLVAAAARQVLGRDHVLAVTAASASLAEREREAASQLAHVLDVSHQFIVTQEFSNPNYVSNPSNRCFYCKDELYGRLSPLAQANQMIVVDGFNASDRADYRPGYKASQQRDVHHPLDEAHLLKSEIRALSRWLKLPTWNKPASPCLSSRVPYGISITPVILKQIDQAESILRTEGFPIVRVRHFGNKARVEVPLEDIARLSESKSRLQLAFQNIGYSIFEIDPNGFRSGALNEALHLTSSLVEEKN